MSVSPGDCILSFVSVSSQGNKGDKGDTGPVGPAGPPGAAGSGGSVSVGNKALATVNRGFVILFKKFLFKVKNL